MTASGTSTPNTPNDVVVSVRGEATLEVEPELCEFTVTVQARDKDRRTTLERIAQRNSELLDEIKAYGEAVEKHESSGFTVHPEQKGRRRDEKVDSYLGAVRVRVVVNDFTVVGEMITRLADAQNRSVDGPFWQLRRDSAVYSRARTEAVAEAVTRAREYTAALGCTLTGMLELADTGLSSNAAPRAHAFGGMMRSAMAVPAGASYEAPPLDLEPERQTVYASVEARFTSTQPATL